VVKEYQTRVLKPTTADLRSDPAIVEAAELIRAGELVAFPTETVYGLGADATSQSAVEAIFTAKRRPADNPVIVHVGELAAVNDVADASDPRILLLAHHFWPGPLTLVIPAREPLRIAACRGLDTVAVRMPSHAVALAIIRAAALPVAAPSANLSGRPSPTTARHVLDDLGGRIPLVLDGGPCEFGIESTVLDLSGQEPRVLRPGAVSEGALSSVLGCSVAHAAGADLRRSPGTRYRHYQPSVPVIVVPRDVSEAVLSRFFKRMANAGTRIGYVGIGSCPSGLASEVIHLEIDRRPGELGRCLYAYFRHLDNLQVSRIVVRSVAAEEPAMERLLRAASVNLTSDEEVESYRG
jgi:L-threonylcarbamoyladenylate synthase